MINKTNFLARLITGAVYIAIILSGILTNSVLILSLIFLVFAGLACFEFQSVTGTNRYHLMLKIVHSILTGLAFFIVFAWRMEGVSFRRYLILLLPYLAYTLYYSIGEMYRNRPHPIRELGMAFFSHLYIGLPLGMLILLTVDPGTTVGGTRFLDHVSHTFWLLPIFSFVWLNDTGAYVVGSLMGKHKLFERISPKKTWEGLIGGVFFCLLGAVAFHYLFPEISRLYHWLILALLVSVFATWGDLFESFIKRSYHVKDAGHILPGHGGILDRIDSLLFATYPAYIYINIVIYVI